MKIKLWEKDIPYFNAELDCPNYMTAYLVDTDKPTPAVVIYPGGGYSHRAYHEGEPIAKFFNSRGYHAFVVEYRVNPYTYPAELIDAQRAIKLVRYHAKEWMVDSEKIITCGFSAGGHLTAMTLTKEDVCTVSGDDTDKMSAKPNGGILCYALTDVGGEFGHEGSGRNLLGDDYESKKEEFNLVKLVDNTCPPCFIWHTFEDKSVNVKNALCFAEALKDNNVPFELHVFPNGHHGLGIDKIDDSIKEVRQWAGLAADWLDRTFQENTQNS